MSDREVIGSSWGNPYGAQTCVNCGERVTMWRCTKEGPMCVRDILECYERAQQQRLRAVIEEADRWYAEELERLRERAPA